MNAQDVANMRWALETLGLQAGDGVMRCALEGGLQLASHWRKKSHFRASVECGMKM
jgi:hypothetical protein